MKRQREVKGQEKDAHNLERILTESLRTLSLVRMDSERSWGLRTLGTGMAGRLSRRMGRGEGIDGGMLVDGWEVAELDRAYPPSKSLSGRLRGLAHKRKDAGRPCLP